MTHDELLAEIDSYAFVFKPKTALRAVVELHKPDIENKYCAYDSPEWEIVTYPCPTIQAIEKELR